MKIRISALISKASLLLMILFASILMPFNIYADQLPQSEIVGVSWNLIDTEISLSSGGNWYTYTYELEVKLKNKYVGVVDGTLSYTYSSVQNTTSSPTSKTDTTTKRNYVNGDSFKFNVYISNIGLQFTGNGPMYNCSYLINNSTTNVTKYEDLNSIESVVNILSDIYQNSTDIEGLSTNQLAELVKIVSNTSLANEYLNVLTKIRDWHFPIESLSYIVYFMNRNFDIYDFYKINSYWEYPLFKISSNTTIAGQYLGVSSITYYDVVFYTSCPVRSDTFNNYFEISNGALIDFNNISIVPFDSYKIIKLRIGNAVNDGNVNLKYIGNGVMDFIPIFIGRSDVLEEGFISTDFALMFGLSNKLLDDLDIIVNGTNQSNQQSSDLSSGTDSMQDQMNDLVGVEDSYNQQFNNSVNSIDFSNPLQQNQGLLGASNFVITVFNGLIANNPFSILIIIVCILLIGKKVIGK